MTGKEVRALGIKAVAELRAHGGLPALADWIEALDAAMDVSTEPEAKGEPVQYAERTAAPASDDPNMSQG